MNNHIPAQDANNISNPVSSGADLGAKAGLLLSAFYMVLVVVIFGDWDLASSYFAITLGVYAAILIPVLLLGVLTGTILGWLLKRFSGVISKQRYIQAGIFVCLILLAAFHIVFFTGVPLASSLSIREYWILIGFPGIIYVISGGWISHELWLKA